MVESSNKSWIALMNLIILNSSLSLPQSPINLNFQILLFPILNFTLLFYIRIQNFLFVPRVKILPNYFKKIIKITQSWKSLIRNCSPCYFDWQIFIKLFVLNPKISTLNWFIFLFKLLDLLCDFLCPHLLALSI